MNLNEMKLCYKAPIVELIVCYQPLNLLVSMSGSAGFEDWEEGDEL